MREERQSRGPGPGSRRPPWLACVLVATAALATGCRTNPVTGQWQLSLIGEEREIALGHQNHPNVVFMYDGEYHDPELNSYLGTIAMRLHEVSHRPGMPMEFTMLNTSTINAFATPAHVYATRGFLARIRNEAEFAAVMGHELSHVAAGHSARQLSASVLTGLGFGLAGAVADEGTVARLALGTGQIGVALLGLSYSREQERQADRVGTYYMALAGWDPRQAIEMQKLLNSLSNGGGDGGGLQQYLSTHPQAGSRIGEVEDVIREMELATPRYIQGDGVYEQRWKGRLRRLREVDRAFEPYDRGMKLLGKERHEGALAAAREALDMRTDQAPFHRLEGDALLGLNRLEEAEAAYRDSLERDSRYVLANMGLGRVHLRQGKPAEAERQFEIAARGYPGGLMGWYGLGVSRYRQKRYAEAIEPLEMVAQSAPKEPMVSYILAVCYDETGRYGQAYESYQRALQAGLAGPEAQHARRRLSELEPLAMAPH